MLPLLPCCQGQPEPFKSFHRESLIAESWEDYECVLGLAFRRERSDLDVEGSIDGLCWGVVTGGEWGVTSTTLGCMEVGEVRRTSCEGGRDARGTIRIAPEES